MQVTDHVRTRFWQKVSVSGGCWLWHGSLSRKGYGAMTIQGKYIPAHRIAYLLHYGELPSHLFVCHTCDVRNCVRPDHLFLGTAKDNACDRAAKERGGQAKFTTAQVQEIRALHAPGTIGYKRLARQYGVTVTVIARLITRRTYKEVS